VVAPDLSGNGIHAMQTDNSHQPIFKTNILNGNPVMRFDGSSQWLTCAASTLHAETSGMTVLVVSVPRATVSGTPRIISRGTGSNHYSISPNATSAGRAIYYAPSSTTTISVDPAAAVSGTANILGLTMAGTTGSTLYYRRDGAQRALGTIGTAGTGDTTSQLAFGSDGTATDLWNGDIAEVMIWQRVLNASELATTEGYLGTKYGITLSSGFTFSDDFNRSDAASTGNGGAASLNALPIVSNQLGVSGPSVASVYDLVPGVATTAAQYAQATVIARPTASVPDPMVVVRYVTATADGSGGNPDAYFGRYNVSAGAWQLFKATGGVSTSIGSLTESAPSLPYTIRIEAQGSTIRLLSNSVQKISVTDATLTAGRRLGVSMRYTVAGDTAQRVDNFIGGDL